jgi:hypothetical protein
LPPARQFEGALQLVALHRELALSGKMAGHQFNDAVLRENVMTVEMLRAILCD